LNVYIISIKQMAARNGIGEVMNGNIDPVTLILIIVAVVIALRLRSVLGRRDDENGPMDGYSPHETRAQRERTDPSRDDNIVPLPNARIEDDQLMTEEAVDIKEVIRKFAPEGSPLERGLLEISAVDSSFNPESFISGAKKAYEMIVVAFGESNRKMLKDLLAKQVYEGFVAAIDDREKKQLIVDNSFVGIDKASFVSAEIRDNRDARVTVRFVSSLITATHDRNGTVVEGDPKKVREVTDIWTFSRDVNSRDPNWQLVATEAAS
jgi:predicted lipid-binding transport protein (Tim44 family)